MPGCFLFVVAVDGECVCVCVCEGASCMFLLRGWNNKCTRKHCVSKIFSNIYIQGGQKFLGHFKYHIRSQTIQINQMASYLMNEAEICNKSEFYYSL